MKLDRKYSFRILFIVLHISRASSLFLYSFTAFISIFTAINGRARLGKAPGRLTAFRLAITCVTCCSSVCCIFCWFWITCWSGFTVNWTNTCNIAMQRNRTWFRAFQDWTVTLPSHYWCGSRRVGQGKCATNCKCNKTNRDKLHIRFKVQQQFSNAPIDLYCFRWAAGLLYCFHIISSAAIRNGIDVILCILCNFFDVEPHVRKLKNIYIAMRRLSVRKPSFWEGT